MLRLFSPAKINLFLRIVSKRPDGFHHLSSVFQTISLGDTLTIELHECDVLTCTDPQLPVDSSNLIMKAVKLFRSKTGFKPGFKIHLNKKIPTEAGLGGGSSNAATTLWACNQLANSCLPIETLQQWGADLGSDVPFFLSQGTAFCTGRGELVHSLPSQSPRSVLIVKPKEGLSTPAVYRTLNFQPSSSDKNVEGDLKDFLSGSPHYFNDLEKPAFEIKPELLQLKALLLKSGFEVVLMSGSGSSFFCLGHGAIPQLPGVDVFPAHYVNRSVENWYTND